MANKTMNINQNYVKQLYTIVDEEMSVYKEILETEKEKYELLMKGMFVDLDPINDKLAEQLKSSIKIEQKRITISGLITRELGIPLDSSFKQIVDKLPDEYAEKFYKAVNDFKSLIKDIKVLNELNSRLILDSKRLIDVTLNAYINDSKSMEINYADQIKKSVGKSFTQSNPKLFNRKV